MNLSEQTFLGHDPETWVCVRCGMMRQEPFTWAHRPRTDPGIRTCGGQVVPARLLHHCKELIDMYWKRMAKHLMDAESGKIPDSAGGNSAYGIPQMILHPLGGSISTSQIRMGKLKVNRDHRW